MKRKNWSKEEKLNACALVQQQLDKGKKLIHIFNDFFCMNSLPSLSTYYRWIRYDPDLPTQCRKLYEEDIYAFFTEDKAWIESAQSTLDSCFLSKFNSLHSYQSTSKIIHSCANLIPPFSAIDFGCKNANGIIELIHLADHYNLSRLKLIDKENLAFKEKHDLGLYNQYLEMTEQNNYHPITRDEFEEYIDYCEIDAYDYSLKTEEKFDIIVVSKLLHYLEENAYNFVRQTLKIAKPHSLLFFRMNYNGFKKEKLSEKSLKKIIKVLKPNLLYREHWGEQKYHLIAIKRFSLIL